MTLNDKTWKFAFWQSENNDSKTLHIMFAVLAYKCELSFLVSFLATLIHGSENFSGICEVDKLGIWLSCLLEALS